MKLMQYAFMLAVTLSSFAANAGVLESISECERPKIPGVHATDVDYDDFFAKLDAYELCVDAAHPGTEEKKPKLKRTPGENSVSAEDIEDVSSFITFQETTGGCKKPYLKKTINTDVERGRWIELLSGFFDCQSRAEKSASRYEVEEPRHMCDEPVFPDHPVSAQERDALEGDVLDYRQCLEEFIDEQKDAIKDHQSAEIEAEEDLSNLKKHHLEKF